MLGKYCNIHVPRLPYKQCEPRMRLFWSLVLPKLRLCQIIIIHAQLKTLLRHCDYANPLFEYNSSIFLR